MSQTAAYLKQPRSDQDALVRDHGKLVKSIAYHMSGRLPPNVPVDDLIQSGMIGLLEAARNYDAGMGAERLSNLVFRQLNQAAA